MAAAPTAKGVTKGAEVAVSGLPLLLVIGIPFDLTTRY
jgi:hypothetical protein